MSTSLSAQVFYGGNLRAVSHFWKAEFRFERWLQRTVDGSVKRNRFVEKRQQTCVRIFKVGVPASDAIFAFVGQLTPLVFEFLLRW
jgi:hypothetical protein